MNKIVLNKPLLINKRYVVYIDSDNKFSFTNRRAAQDFITRIEQEVEEAILFITEEFNMLEQFYRLYYLADRDFKFKFAIANSIEFINNRLVWMQSREGSPNHDTILYHGIIACIEELGMGFRAMQAKAASRKDTITKRRCALKSHLIEIYREKLISLKIKPVVMNLQIKRSKQG